MFEGSHVFILYVAMATVKYDGLFWSRSEQTMQTVKDFGDVSKKIKKKQGNTLIKYIDNNLAFIC